jgi:hypothetical protein
LNSHEDKEQFAVSVEIFALIRCLRQVSPEMNGRCELSDVDQDLHAIPVHQRSFHSFQKSEACDKTGASQGTSFNIVSGNRELVVLGECPGAHGSY